jgi:lipopolysaccharide/colanic/teichoic acid biosynthesis glycosyltransferase
VGWTRDSLSAGRGMQTSRLRATHRQMRTAWASASPRSGSQRGSARSAVWLKLRVVLKRTFDAIVALLLLGSVLPVSLVIAIAIKLDSPGPVFYRVRRVGYRGRPLMMLKFRKMQDDAAGIPLTAHADARLTRVGRVLTQTRLDELPQLLDVLRGRMSIVGPRPEDPGFVALHADAYRHILSVRPGITGLSQLAFAEERKILDEHDPVADYVNRILPQKIGLDTLYARSYRLRTDVAVLCWTVIALLLRRPIAVNRSSGRMNVRKRPGEAGVPEQPGVIEID